MTIEKNTFYTIIPGSSVPGDWFAGKIPGNIEVGKNSVIDSSFCFQYFFSTLPTALKIGDHVTFWRTSISSDESAYISIGDFCYIANASIVCSEQISIGNYVFIAGGVTIADSDFHPITPAARLADTIALSPVGDRRKRPVIRSAPVTIEDHVWIGPNAAIMKGVHVGEGAVIQPGSVVLEDVAPGAVVAGNPAKKVSDL